jgi:hypothetical protein
VISRSMSHDLEANVVTICEPRLRGCFPPLEAARIRLASGAKRRRSDDGSLRTTAAGPTLNPRGDLYGFEYKGVTRKGIRKVMKTKGGVGGHARRGICKWMKTKRNVKLISRRGSLLGNSMNSGTAVRKGSGESRLETGEGAGWNSAITTYFIRWKERGKLVEGTKRNHLSC